MMDQWDGMGYRDTLLSDKTILSRDEPCGGSLLDFLPPHAPFLTYLSHALPMTPNMFPYIFMLIIQCCFQFKYSSFTHSSCVLFPFQISNPRYPWRSHYFHCSSHVPSASLFHSMKHRTRVSHRNKILLGRTRHAYHAYRNDAIMNIYSRPACS